MKVLLCIIYLVVYFSLASCAVTSPIVELSPGADKVKIFRKVDPPISCVEINTVEVFHGTGCGAMGSLGDFRNAYKLFKNEILNVGGNSALIQSETAPHYALDCYVNKYTIRGIAYDCPSKVFE